MRTIISAVVWPPLLSAQSLIRWAESQGGPLFVWALNLQALQAFLFPRQGGEGCWLHILIPRSLFLHPSIPQCPVYSRQPCGCATSEALQTTKVLAAASDWPVTALTMGTTRGAAVGGEWCWWWLSGGDFFSCTGPGRRVKVWLLVARPKIYRNAAALCGQVTSYVKAPSQKHAALMKKKWFLTLELWRRLIVHL